MSDTTNQTPAAEPRRLDFWVDMYKETADGKRKIREFAEMIGMEQDRPLLDSIIMLCENFVQAAQDEREWEKHRDSQGVEDFAHDIKEALFHWTFDSSAAARAYVDYLKLGIHDYHHERTDEQDDQRLRFIGDRIARHQQILAEEAAEWDAKRAERKAVEEAAKAPESEPVRDPKEEKQFNQKMLALDLSRVLENPELPRALWEEITEWLVSWHKTGPFSDPKFIAKSLEVGRTEEAEKTQEVANAEEEN